MMCRAVRRFRDKVTGAIHKAGAKVDVTPKRAAELIKAGVVEALEDFPAKKDKADKAEE